MSTSKMILPTFKIDCTSSRYQQQAPNHVKFDYISKHHYHYSFLPTARSNNLRKLTFPSGLRTVWISDNTRVRDIMKNVGNPDRQTDRPTLNPSSDKIAY